MKEFEVKGTIKLDKESEEKIIEELRKEVIKDVVTDKELSSEEIVQILNSWSWSTFYHILKEIMPLMMDKIKKEEEDDEIVFSREKRMANTLTILNMVLNLMV